MPSKLPLATAGVALLLAVLPTSAHATDVCNEAENSHRGGYTVEGAPGPVDPNPPAFLRGSQMKVGNGAGVVNAAEHSPTLRLCVPEGSTPTDPPSDGCGDGGPIVTVN